MLSLRRLFNSFISIWCTEITVFPHVSLFDQQNSVHRLSVFSQLKHFCFLDMVQLSHLCGLRRVPPPTAVLEQPSQAPPCGERRKRLQIRAPHSAVCADEQLLYLGFSSWERFRSRTAASGRSSPGPRWFWTGCCSICPSFSPRLWGDKESAGQKRGHWWSGSVLQRRFLSWHKKPGRCLSDKKPINEVLRTSLSPENLQMPALIQSRADSLSAH